MNNRLAEESYYRETGKNRYLILRKHNKLSNTFYDWLNKKGFIDIIQENNFVDVTFKKTVKPTGQS